MPVLAHKVSCLDTVQMVMFVRPQTYLYRVFRHRRSCGGHKVAK